MTAKPTSGRDLFVVHSPWQLLNAEEAQEVYRSTGGDLVVLIDDALRAEQIEGALERSTFQRVHLVDRAHLGELRLDGPRRTFLGDYRNPHQRRIARAADAGRPVVLDDGNATLMVADQRARRLWRLRDPKRQGVSTSKHERRLPIPGLVSDLRHPSAAEYLSIELFSIYRVRGARRDRHVPNQLTRLRRQLAAPDAPSHPIFVGSHLAEVGMLDPVAYGATLGRAVEEADGSLLYFAHRKESDERLARYEAQFGVEVIRPPVPIELALIDMGVRPSQIWVVMSSAFDTLRILYPEADQRWLPPQAADLAGAYRRPVARLVDLTSRAQLVS